MTRIIIAVVASVALAAHLVAPSFAASCGEEAAAKKLAGAALNSFMAKCEREAAEATCGSKAASQSCWRGQEELHDGASAKRRPHATPGRLRKRAGAAKNSFTKKCVTEAVGG